MLRKKLLLDTGPLVALMVKRDDDHLAAKAFFSELDAVLLTTWPVITETCHFIEPRFHAGLMREIANGTLGIVDIFYGVDRMAELMEKYRDIGPDLADISLVYAAEVTGVHRVVIRIDIRSHDRCLASRWLQREAHISLARIT